MPEGGFFEPRRINAPGLVIVVTLHAVVLTAVALSKKEVIKFHDRGVIAFPIKEEPLPPPDPTPKPKPTDRLPRVSNSKTPHDVFIKLPVDTSQDLTKVDPTLDAGTGSVAGDDGPGVIVNPPKPLVRVAAVMDVRSDLQPPYPPSEERAGTEGVAVVRVLVGLDGRIKAVEKVSATSDAFYRATERQALLHWRFKPATVDGAPVESWQQLTVRFKIPVGDG